jgi:hypothetical protein
VVVVVDSSDFQGCFREMWGRAFSCPTLLLTGRDNMAVLCRKKHLGSGPMTFKQVLWEGRKAASPSWGRSAHKSNNPARKWLLAGQVFIW